MEMLGQSPSVFMHTLRPETWAGLTAQTGISNLQQSHNTYVSMENCVTGEYVTGEFVTGGYAMHASNGVRVWMGLEWKCCV